MARTSAGAAEEDSRPPLARCDVAGPVADTPMRYRGVQAGEVDWRPTGTTPEDYYAF